LYIDHLLKKHQLILIIVFGTVMALWIIGLH